MDERQIATANGWGQQTFNTWKSGSVPRPRAHAAIARFLKITPAQVAELAEEANVSTGNTKLPDMGAPVMGIGHSDTAIMEAFAIGYAKPSIEGCYAVRLGGRHYWVNPRMKPQDGNLVLVRTNEVGKLMTWPNEYTADGIEQHVVVLQQMF